MSKYIVDTDDFEPMFKVDSIGVFGIGKSVTDNTEGHSWSRIKSLVDFEELNSDYINEHYGQLQDEAYKRGFEDGKGAIHKGCEGCRYSGTPQGDSPCFSCSNYYPNNWTAKKQDDEIEVRDEVVWTEDENVAIVVTCIYTADNIEWCDGVRKDGRVFSILTKHARKTGRHFDIESILEDMRE